MELSGRRMRVASTALLVASKSRDSRLVIVHMVCWPTQNGFHYLADIT